VIDRLIECAGPYFEKSQGAANMHTVHVIEDDDDIRELMTYKLTQSGFDVHAEADGEAGLAAIHELRPEIVVLDWIMPKLSGVDVCLQVRATPELEGTGVLLLTAKSQEADVQRGLAAGADDYLVKPFSPRELVRRVETLLAGRV
jgi:DNA-binding response OmpR family regulator